jgi:hypothetical protein
MMFAFDVECETDAIDFFLLADVIGIGAGGVATDVENGCTIGYGAIDLLCDVGLAVCATTSIERVGGDIDYCHYFWHGGINNLTIEGNKFMVSVVIHM